MLKRLAALALLVTVTGCDEPKLAANGRLVANCATPADTTTVVGDRPVRGHAGPCHDDTDRTDRTDRTDLTDRTDRTNRDDTADRTDRTLRDDTTDRTVWCIEPAMLITAPSFNVFFDFDKSDLTPAAQDTIAKAVVAYRTKGGAQIRATGHTDRAGTEAYNMALSLRRANTVRDMLVRDGVPASDISVVGVGESQPLVPTADGVREAQNRRVEIVIR